MSQVGSTTMVRKRPHRKVRSGCYRCKSKKVKCDERKPQCSHCERYSAECNYPILSVSEKSVSPAPVASASPSTNGTSPLTSGTSPPTHRSSPRLHGTRPHSDAAPAKPNPEQHELNMADLELLHHWTLSAHDGFGDLPGDEAAWKGDIVRLAMQHTFLMHGILSVSALHLALLRPNQQDHYLRASAHHHNLALPFYRFVMADIVHHLNEENCHPLFAFASITTAYSIAYPAATDDDPLPPSPTPKWFYLVRGPRNIVSNSAADLWSVCAVAGPWLVNGPMAFSLRQISGPIDTAYNPDDAHYAALDALLAPHAGSTSPPPADLDVYRRTLALLREAAATPFQPAQQGAVGPKMAALQFVEKAPERFVDLLSECRPEALVLMAHLCVLLKQAERFWFMHGAAERHLGTVVKLLDPRFRRWLQWPLQKVPALVP